MGGGDGGGGVGIDEGRGGDDSIEKNDEGRRKVGPRERDCNDEKIPAGEFYFSSRSRNSLSHSSEPP